MKLKQTFYTLHRSSCFLLFALLLLADLGSANAQWLTQTISLKSGWNAVYLHVDPSYNTISNLVATDAGNPITEIWMWSPPVSTAQFVQSPMAPIAANDQWIEWTRLASGSSPLKSLVGNAAYLVRVSTNVSTYTWTVKGKAVPPNYRWTTSGLNFLGFPTVPSGAPTFETFLSGVPELQNAEIYQYTGGELSSSNPARVYNTRTTTVKRGQAFWVRSGQSYNRYFAPFEITLAGTGGVDFGDSLNVRSIRLRNLTAAPLTVTAKSVSSETPPSGQKSIAGVPPLLIRGSLNSTNLTYDYRSLPAGGTNWTLAAAGQPGSEIEVVVGLNRATMSGNVGDVLACVLRLNDSLGYAQIDLPVTATVASSAGLWVGSAAITQVGQYLKTYTRDSANKPIANSNGQYIVESTNSGLANVPTPVTLRLIVHNPESSGNAVLLERVYVGVNAATNNIVATQESALNAAFRSTSRRVSATHLPWTKNNAPWSFDGRLNGAGTLTTTVLLDYADQASNPFLHTYHPDHDNLDATFKSQLPQGSESYSVRRDITLTITPPAADASDFSAGERTISGNYSETITVLGLARGGGTTDSRTFEVRGIFSLTRISTVPVLTTQ